MPATDVRPVSLTREREDLSYKVAFREVLFPLGATPRSLHFVFSRLKPFALRLSDLKVEAPPGNVAEFAISCWLPAINTLLKFRLESIELNASAVLLTAPVSDIVSAAIEAARDVAASSYKGLAVYETTWGSHGALGIPVAAYLNSFLKQPWELPGGFGFQVGADPSSGLVGGTTVVAPSALFPGRLFVQVTAVFDGEATVPEVRARFENLRHACLDRLQLKIAEM